MAKQQAPNLRIITENNLLDAYGDPWWGQQKTYSLTFTVAGATLAGNTMLRVRGKK